MKTIAQLKRLKIISLILFLRKKIPTDVLKLRPGKYDIVSVLVEADFSSSKFQTKRVIEQGGVRIDGKVFKDTASTIKRKSLLQKGKMKFIQII